jgi:hypothetical protein
MENVNKHEVILVLPGDIEYVRARLIIALEQFNYCILGEQPIHARGALVPLVIFGRAMSLTFRRQYWLTSNLPERGRRE